MSDDAAFAPEQCPVCGSDLVVGTVDATGIPEGETGVDLPRSEVDPRTMAQETLCPTPDCPGPPSSAEL